MSRDQRRWTITEKNTILIYVHMYYTYVMSLDPYNLTLTNVQNFIFSLSCNNFFLSEYLMTFRKRKSRNCKWSTFASKRLTLLGRKLSCFWIWKSIICQFDKSGVQYLSRLMITKYHTTFWCTSVDYVNIESCTYCG